MRNRIYIISLVLLFFVLSAVAGQTREDFAAIVNFGIDLEALCDLAETNGDVDSAGQGLTIITGSVSSRMVLQPGPEDYLAEIEIVDGRWVGLEDVKTFRCFVQFVGPEYANFVPARRSRRPPAEEIPQNASVMIVGLPTAVRATEAGPVPVLTGYFVRILDK